MLSFLKDGTVSIAYSSVQSVPIVDTMCWIQHDQNWLLVAPFRDNRDSTLLM